VDSITQQYITSGNQDRDKNEDEDEAGDEA
jgi:hypothetical protein